MHKYSCVMGMDSIKPGEQRLPAVSGFRSTSGRRNPAKRVFAHLRRLSSAGVFAMLLGSALPSQGAIRPVSVVSEPSDGFHAEYLLKLTSEISVPVEDAGETFDVGRTLELIDINHRYYVAKVSDGIESRLVAVPRLTSSGQGTAWVTNEKELIFGSRTRSLDGFMLLRRNERLHLVGEEGDSQLTVVLERFGRSVELELPRRDIAYVKEDAPDLFAETTVAPVQPVATNSNEKNSVAPAPKPEAPPRAAGTKLATKKIPTRAPVVDPSITFFTPTPEPAPAPEPVEVDPVAEVSVQAQVEDTVAASAQAPAAHVVQVLPPEPAPQPSADAEVAVPGSEGMAAEPASAPAAIAQPVVPPEIETKLSEFLTLNSWTYKILLITVLLEGALILRLMPPRKFAAHGGTNSNGSSPSNEVFSYSTVGESIIDNGAPSFMPSGDGGDLQGTLDKFAMGHVVQFLHSSGESGSLLVTLPDNQVEKLIFDRGQVIDAQSGTRCGQDAADLILRRRNGSFRFTREDNSSRVRMIQGDTMSILMEAHRMIDEKGWVDS